MIVKTKSPVLYRRNGNQQYLNSDGTTPQMQPGWSIMKPPAQNTTTPPVNETPAQKKERERLFGSGKVKGAVDGATSVLGTLGNILGAFNPYQGAQPQDYRPEYEPAKKSNTVPILIGVGILVVIVVIVVSKKK